MTNNIYQDNVNDNLIRFDVIPLIHDEEKHDSDNDNVHQENANDKLIDSINVETHNNNVDDVYPNTNIIDRIDEDTLAEQLKKDMAIEFLPKDSDQLIHAKVISRAGKVSGKYSSHWNIETEDGVQVVDFANDIQYWRKKDVVSDLQGETGDIGNQADHPDEIRMNEVLILETDKLIEEAKQTELTNWLEEDVYEEIDDCNQRYMSVRWVISKKLVDDRWATKARLVVRGYE